MTALVTGFIQARNYTKVAPGRRVLWLVVHAMQNPEKPGTAKRVSQWFAGSTAPRASAHYNIDAAETWQSVKDQDVAWAASGANKHGLHFEHCGYSEQVAADWSDDFSQRMLSRSEALAAVKCRELGIPPRYVDAAAIRRGEPGITTHAQVEKAFPSCVTADTPVLCADLTWKPAGELLVGDELVAFDEHHVRQTGRRFKRGHVVGNSLERDALLRVTTSRGAVRCNYQHPWLVRRAKAGKWGSWVWVRADELQSGDEVMHVVEPWATDRSWEAGWLAGMYDGEGCLTFSRPTERDVSPQHSMYLACHQRESETADLMIQAIKERAGGGAFIHVRRGRERRQPLVRVVVNKRAMILRLLGSVRPQRLLVMADRVWEGGNLGKTAERAVVQSVEPAGSGLIASLTTSTGTYIAGGFAMHNSGHWDPGLHFPLGDYIANVARLVQPATPQEAHMLFPGTQTVAVPGAGPNALGRWPMWGWKPNGDVFCWNFSPGMQQFVPNEDTKRRITADGANVIGLHPLEPGSWRYYLVTDMADSQAGLNTFTAPF